MPEWEDAVRRRLAELNLDPVQEVQIAEEYAQHAEDRYDELRSGGASESEARRIALQEIADSELMARELRAVECRGMPVLIGWGDDLLRDVRCGVRSLRKSLLWTLLVVAVLAVGIGANVAIFTVVDAAFLRPLQLPEPERLVQLQETQAGGPLPVAYPNFVDWRKQSRLFAAMTIAGVFPETLKTTGGNERVGVGYVSPGFDRTYGIAPVVGRTLTAADDSPAAPPVVLLSDRFWQSHFAGDPGVVGRTLTTDDRIWTIAGVVPSVPWQRADVFVPIAFALEKRGLGMREQHSSTGVTARLRAGVTLDQARAEMTFIAARLAKQYPGSNGGNGVVVIPLREYLGSGLRRPALLMFGAVGMLLLVACANVAGLLFARAAVRQREISIRAALGASRLQLVKQLLTEALLLAFAGTMAGLVVARMTLAGLRWLFPVAEDLGGMRLDVRVLAFSILAAAATAVLCGMAPAIQLTRSSVATMLQAGGRGSRGSALRLYGRRFLVAGQVALAVVLSIDAGLLLRSLLAVVRTDPGFRPENVVIATVLPPDRRDLDLAHNARLLRAITDRLASAPGVLAAGAVDSLPFGNPDSWGDFYRDDRPVPPPGQLPNGTKAAATPGYFRAMGIPLVRGRLFTASDGQMPSLKRDMPSLLAYLQSTELVAVINETMARRFWPGEDPIGKSFRWGPPSLQGPRVRIVGVVGDARQFGLDHPVAPQYYFPADQFPMLDARLVVRTSGEVPGLTSTIRRVVAEEQPDAVVAEVDRMAILIGRTVTARQNNAMLLGLFSAIAVLLAALGLYATMAYAVAQRTQEIGVRMALGAAAGDVRLMVVREGAILAGAGVTIGLCGALAGGRVLTSMLYGVAPTDVPTYAGSALLLVAVMLVGSYVPAWRASRVDPTVALRVE